MVRKMSCQVDKAGAQCIRSSLIGISLLVISISIQLSDCRYAIGDKLVFLLNNLVNDCGCSKPNA